MAGTGNYGMVPMRRGRTAQGISGTPVPSAPLGAPQTNPILFRPKAEQYAVCYRRRQPLPEGTTGGRWGIADGYTRSRFQRSKPVKDEFSELRQTPNGALNLFLFSFSFEYLSQLLLQGY